MNNLGTKTTYIDSNLALSCQILETNVKNILPTLRYLIYDPLTKTKRKNFFHKIYPKLDEMVRSANTTLIFSDINFLGDSNRRYGKLDTNIAMNNLMTLFLNSIETKKDIDIYDYAFRVGGDEFVIILPDTLKKDISLSNEFNRLNTYEDVDYSEKEKAKKDGMLDLTVSMGIIDTDDLKEAGLEISLSNLKKLTEFQTSKNKSFIKSKRPSFTIESYLCDPRTKKNLGLTSIQKIREIIPRLIDHFSSKSEHGLIEENQSKDSNSDDKLQEYFIDLSKIDEDFLQRYKEEHSLQEYYEFLYLILLRYNELQVDTLTNLRNEDSFHFHFNEINGLIERYKNKDCSIVYTNISLKDANDKHGHQSTDKALQELISRFISKIINSASQEAELEHIYNLGAGSLILILPDVTKKTLENALLDFNDDENLLGLKVAYGISSTSELQSKDSLSKLGKKENCPDEVSDFYSQNTSFGKLLTLSKLKARIYQNEMKSKAELSVDSVKTPLDFDELPISVFQDFMEKFIKEQIEDLPPDDGIEPE